MKNLKRLTAFALAVIMIFTILPMSTFAAEADTEPSSVEVTVDDPPSVEDIPAPTPEASPEPLPVPEASIAPDDSPTEVESPSVMEAPAADTSDEHPEIPPVDDFVSAEFPDDPLDLADSQQDDLETAILLASADYNINNGSVTLSTPGTYVISGTGTATTNNITITKAGQYDVTLVNVKIDCSGNKDRAALALQANATVHLTISGENSLASGENRAGIEVPVGCALEVDGTGTITVTGGAGQYDAAAGIGGGAKKSNGSITILGGTITANGGDQSYNGAAGIGGGCGADGKNITIAGGTVVANGSVESYNGAAGIGGGADGDGLDITIQGGSVTATGSKDSHMGAAGIGGGYRGSAQRLTFSGGTTNAQSASGANLNGAGIGGGYGGSASYITISGTAVVDANYGTPNSHLDGSNGAGIGGGGALTNPDNTKVGGHADHITISGGTVRAYGNTQAAGIGGGAGGNATHIEITGGNVKAYGGSSPVSNSSIGGAGIGGGSYGYAEDITIRTGNRDTCTITARSGYSSAGIGGGCNGYAKNITIQDSNVDANAYNSGNYGSGAGIGGGRYGAGVNILIDNSTVNTSAYSGAGIGSGASVGRDDSNNSVSWNRFLTGGGVSLHGSFPTGITVAANIEIRNGSNVTASSSSGAAIGSGSSNYGPTSGDAASRKYAVDVYVHDNERITANSSSGAGIGTGSSAQYCLASVVVDHCESVQSSRSSGAGIGSGESNTWSDMEVSVTNCGTLTMNNSYTYYDGAGIGTGVSNSGGRANVTVDNCDTITGTVYSGTGLGTGYYNGTSGRDTSFIMSVSHCREVRFTNIGYSSSYGGTGIGAGCGNSYNSVEILVDACENISLSSGSYYSTGIGIGYSNSRNSVHVSVLNCGPISVSGSWRYGTAIGVGAGCSNSAADQPTDYQVLVKDCASISMSSSNYCFTGIGTGHNTSSCLGNVTVDNCGSILINHTSGYDSVGIGHGRNTVWANGTKQFYDNHIPVQIKNCGDITIVTNSYNNTGIGMGAYSYYATGEVSITDCGNISVFHGYDPAYNSGTSNNECSVGIGLGKEAYNCDLSVSIVRCSNVSTCYYQDGNGNYPYATYCTGIGSGYNCYSNNSNSYTVEDGSTSYYPNTLNIQIQHCGAVEANCGNGGVAIGMGYNNRDTTSCITIQDCDAVVADGSYYGTGIGSGAECYSNYSYIPGPNSTVTILRCEGGVTAKGGRYGASIGSGGNFRSSAAVSVDIQDCGTVNATQYKLVDDNTISDVNSAQRGHAAAIGSGWNNSNNAQVSIHIQNCEVDAYAEDSAAIGCGDRANTMGVDITLDNCTVTARGGCGAGIGIGDNSTSATVDITLNDCETTATSLAYGAGVGGGLQDNRCTTDLNVNGGSLTATGAGGGSGIGTGPKNGVCRVNVTIDGNPTVVATGSGATDQRLAEGDDETGSDAGAGIGGTAGQYVGNIIIRSGDITAIGGGIEGYCAAGIGGGANAKAGTVTISGGTVHAIGGHCATCGAAGIGAGANSNAGTVTISGGKVTAIGAHGEKMGGAGIGGGPRGDGGTVVIEGGTVVANGSERGAGIGGGFNGNGGDVTISGGTVTVTGGLYDSAGIGGGANGEGGILTLSGNPVLKVYGKSANLAITSEIASSVPLFQGTMALVSPEESIISLMQIMEEGAGEGQQDQVTLPAAYDAFSLTLPAEGAYSAHLLGDKEYLLSTLLEQVEEFDLTTSTPTVGKQLSIIRFFDITFDTGSGSSVPTQSVRINKTVTLPDDPTQPGHLFGGWYTDRACSKPYDFSLPVTTDMTLYAKWIEIQGQPYILYHYKENLEGGWDIGSVEYGGEIPEKLVTAKPLTYEDFYEDKTCPDRVASGHTQQGEFLVLKLYYRRNQLTVMVENAGEDYPTRLSAPYGTLMVLGKPSKEGYDFDKWTDENGEAIDATMPIKIEAIGDTIFANWVLQEGRAAYQIKHYLRSLEGAYVLRVAEDFSGTVGDTVTVTPNDYTGFHVNHSISDETATGIIQADNSLALRVYYDRDAITVRLLDTHNTAESVTVEYGAAANLPTPSWPGYTFEGWQLADGSFYEDGDKIETLGEAVTAQWSAGATTLYTVRYYKQDIKGQKMEIVSLEDLYGAVDTTVRAAIRDYPGFTFDAELSNVTGVVDAESPLILNVYYTRNTYDVSFVSNGGSAVAPQNGIYYTALATAPDKPTKTGYDFEGWYTDKALGDKHNFGVPVTHDLTLYAKWTPRDDTAYTVYHYQQNVTGAGYTLANTEHLQGTTDSTVTAEAKNYPGFHRNSDHSDNVVSKVVAPNGSTVLKLYYDRDLHTATFHTLGGSLVSKLLGIRYGAAISKPADPTKVGYTFVHWQAVEEGGKEYLFASPVLDDLALYALWQANTYHVTFDYHGATGDNSTANKTVTFDAAYGELPAPTRHGYDFLGWFTAEQAGEQITEETSMVTPNDHTLHAHWQAREDTPYTVEHYHQSPSGVGHTLVDTDHLTGVTDTTVTAVPKEYPGLMEDASAAGRVYSGNLAGDGSLVLKLYYIRARHTLTIDRANGQGVETHTVLYGAPVTMPGTPRRRGYTFTGWTAKGTQLESGATGFEMPDNNVTLTATWQAIDYSVTYQYEGTVPSGAPALPEGGRNHNIGDVLEVAPVPTLEGYGFQGWDTEDVSVADGRFTMPDSNVVFTGQWRKGLHNVIYIYQGTVPENAPKPPVDTNAYPVGAQVTVLSAPALEGYTFSGWQSDVEVTDGVFRMPIVNVVFHGVWTPKLYAVQFSYAGDIPDSAQQLPSEDQRAMGDTVAVPAVVPVEGYRFCGWTVDGVAIEDGAIQMPASDVSITGRWEKIPYRVSYAYTGAVPVKAPALPKETTYTLGDAVQPIAHPVLKGYAFSGWDTAPFSMPAHDVILKGSWSVVEYTISYVLDGGENPVSNPGKYTIETPSITFAAPTKTGHTFQGWFTDSGFTKAVEKLPSGSAGNVTLYAKWAKNPTTPSGGGGGGGGFTPQPPKPVEPLNKADHMAYIQGFPDGTVRPHANISRAEVATIFFRLLTEAARKENATTKHSFSDVEDGAWYAEAVATLTAMGILKGRSTDCFDPMATITRAEFAAVAARFDSEVYDGPDLFPDIEGHWANAEINRAAKKGWVKGDNNGLFRPNSPITRAEAVTLINRVLERTVEKDVLLPEMKSFPDNSDPTVWYYTAIQEAANSHTYTKDKTEKETWVEVKKSK